MLQLSALVGLLYVIATADVLLRPFLDPFYNHEIEDLREEVTADEDKNAHDTRRNSDG